MREIMLIIHFVGLAMGLGTSFAFMFLGIASSRMEESESRKFRLNTFALSRMGHIGLALLIITGTYLMGPYWSILIYTPLLMLKLILVLVLSILIGVISSIAKKAKQDETGKLLKKIELLGQATLLVTMMIIVLAVYIFH